MSGAFIFIGAVLRAPGVLVVGVALLATLPINRWTRHWMTESMYVALVAASRGARGNTAGGLLDERVVAVGPPPHQG